MASGGCLDMYQLAGDSVRQPFFSCCRIKVR